MNIWKAASSGNDERINILLDEGINIDSRDKYGFTPLILASSKTRSSSSLDTVKLLLDKGADINARTDSGYTALMHSVGTTNSTSSLDTVKLLLDNGADINAKTNSGTNALILSAGNSNNTSSLETVKLLLDNGADINAKTNSGETALTLSVKNSNTKSSLDTIRLLLDKRANPFDIKKEKTIIDICPTAECKKLVSEYIWKALYKRDKDLAEKFAYLGETKFPEQPRGPRLHSWYTSISEVNLPVDVWEVILLNKRQQLLCSKLQSSKNREVLMFFALELGISIAEEMSKGQLCGLISRQLMYGKYNDKSIKEIQSIKKDMLRLAKKLNISTSGRNIEDIMKDISSVL